MQKMYKADPKQRILRNVTINEENGCWEWKTNIQKNGYAKTSYLNKSIHCHRLSYIIFKGPIDNGLDVCHACDNRKCVNPDHLFLGTRKENMQDAVSKNRQAKGFMLPNTKLSKEDIKEIVRLKFNGVKTKEIAERFNVCTQHINYLYRRANKCAE